MGRRTARAGDAALNPSPSSAAAAATAPVQPAPTRETPAATTPAATTPAATTPAPTTPAPTSTPHWAEALARRALERRGWTTLAANARTRGGEIDLVMVDGDAVVFVEVRQRARADHGSAAESLDGRKLARVRRAAARWLAQHGRHDDRVRFDAVLVDGGPPVPRVRLVRDAF